MNRGCVRFVLRTVPFLAVLGAPSTATAQQQVTLKSGVIIVGAVQLSPDAVTIKVGQSDIRLPMSDVAVIAPAGHEQAKSADHLLIIALEAQAQHGPSDAIAGLLSEAARQKPDDPRIAYWQASSLLEAGHGAAASRIFQAHHAEIMEAYPGVGERLVERIRRRMELEGLPPELVRRLDALARSLEVTPGDSERPNLYVRFRLVDDQGAALQQAAFNFEANGGNERIEDFGQGYFLVSYRGYENLSGNPARIRVNFPGYRATEHVVPVRASQVTDGGTIVVHRYSEADQRSVSFTVTGPDGKPLAGARVQVRTQIRGGDPVSGHVATSGDQGRCEFKLYPGVYAYTVTADEFRAASSGLEVAPDGAPHDVQVQLFHILEAKLRVVWQSNSAESDRASVYSGDAIVQLNDQNLVGGPYDASSPSFISVRQTEDRLTLQVGGPPYFSSANRGQSGERLVPWLRRVPVEDVEDGEAGDDGETERDDPDAVKARFDEIDLAKIADIKGELEPPELDSSAPRHPAAPIAVAARPGDIFIGETAHRTPDGRPTLVRFKLIVTEVTARN